MVVVITGANNGIGFRMAQALLGDGYRVAGCDLGVENLAQLQAAYPERLLAQRCDVTDDVQVRAAVESAIQRWGQIDILVNNACLALFTPFEQKTMEEVRQEFEVNYFGYLRMIRAVVPHMKARGAGLIHNVSSGVGITGFPGLSGYTSTKGAVEALTRTLALELARDGIHVNLMHPPLTKTKSAAPLGLPPEVMDDPARVGRGLARQIRSTQPVIASDLRTAIYLFFAYRYPEALGGLFAKLTDAQRAQGRSMEEKAQSEALAHRK
jgi:NAD(P)-dependent dehydrogenase (short-subunit alcohol dehydrogenase family)